MMIFLLFVTRNFVQQYNKRQASSNHPPQMSSVDKHVKTSCRMKNLINFKFLIVPISIIIFFPIQRVESTMCIYFILRNTPINMTNTNNIDFVDSVISAIL